MSITRVRSVCCLFYASLLYLFVTGCGTTQPSHYYILSSLEDVDDSVSSIRNTTDERIGLGPINFPKYLDRSSIVIRRANSEININDTHRWAEPLENNFTQVITHNLQMLLTNYVVTAFPWRNAKSIDYQVAIDVYRFDADTDNNVMLSVQWTLLRKDDNQNLHVEKRIITEKAENNSYSALVKKQSEVVEMFSMELSEKLKEILQRPIEN